MIDLAKITTPFGLLDKETQEALRDCGSEIEYFNGNYWVSIESISYIVGEYVFRAKPEPVKPIVIPWDAIADKWQYAAADEGGEIWLYADEPRINACDWGDTTGQCIDNILKIDRGNIPWDQSLQARP